jgi:DNA-binding response OmpR family regulator
MPHSDGTFLPAVGHAQIRPARPNPKQTGLFQCLVVSAQPARQELLSRAAAESGWKTVVCSDAASALACLGVMFLQLAMVDLEGEEPEAYGGLLAQLAPSTGLLLIVCGNEGEEEEEIWVRQLGAWLYLPGARDGDEIALLCREARHIAEKLCAMREQEEQAVLTASRTVSG